MNVLSSCKKVKSVKRVVLTSSCSSIRYRYDVQQVSPLNESHWSDIDYCKEYNVMEDLHISANFSISHKHSFHYRHLNSLCSSLHPALVRICKDNSRERCMGCSKGKRDRSSCREPFLCGGPIVGTTTNEYTSNDTRLYYRY